MVEGWKAAKEAMAGMATGEGSREAEKVGEPSVRVARARQGGPGQGAGGAGLTAASVLHPVCAALIGGSGQSNPPPHKHSILCQCAVQ